MGQSRRKFLAGSGATATAPALAGCGGSSSGHHLGRRLGPLRQDSSPFAAPVPREHARTAVWVRPLLVAEVEFASWTAEGRLRAASYQGLRDDKEPSEVTREP